MSSWKVLKNPSQAAQTFSKFSPIRSQNPRPSSSISSRAGRASRAPSRLCFMRKTARGFITLRQRRHIVAVEDCVQAYLLALKTEGIEGQTFMIAMNDPFNYVEAAAHGEVLINATAGGGSIVLGDLLRLALISKGAAVSWPEDPSTTNVRGLWKWGAYGR